MLILLILVTGTIGGLLPGLLRLDDKVFKITNVVVGCIGALAGAVLGFGDAPLFLKYPIFNEKTLMVAGSILFVCIKVWVTSDRTAR